MNHANHNEVNSGAMTSTKENTTNITKNGGRYTMRGYAPTSKMGENEAARTDLVEKSKKSTRYRAPSIPKDSCYRRCLHSDARGMTTRNTLRAPGSRRNPVSTRYDMFYISLYINPSSHSRNRLRNLWNIGTSNTSSIRSGSPCSHSAYHG